MKRLELKVARIGNSRGVRIPAVTLDRYDIGDTVIMEERSDGILLRPIQSPAARLSWEETAAQMAAAPEDWSVWDETIGDGLDAVPWTPSRPQRVAEVSREYPAKGKRKK